MLIPTSPIDICNLALDRLGQDSIASIDPPVTKNENICARNYDTTRRELIRGYIFNFSKKLIKLTKDATFAPAFGYSSAFALPNDFIRLLALGNIAINADTDPRFYDFAEGRILTDQDTSGTIDVSYIFNAEDVNKYDPLFIKLLKLSLASAMAYKFTLKNTFVRALETELIDVRASASAVSGQEKPPRRIERSRWRNVRKQGIFLNDNTRV